MTDKKSLAAPMIASDGSPKHSSNSPSPLKTTFPTPDNDSVLICSVGGVGQIGMNWTLYGHRGRWILVDAGSQFAPRDIDGVEAIFPDPQSLKSVLPRLDALIVTHAHEDHIGAIHRLWPQIKCPIVATKFAAEVLKQRFEERDTKKKVKIKLFNPGDKFQIGGFKIETIGLTHSVPECVGLAIKTKAGTIWHTGDWKFDPKPVVGRRIDVERLKRLGKEGVLAMVCDSTNANRRSPITSENDVAKGMEAVFRDTDGLVAVTCFATNIARVVTAIKAATKSGRKVAISGRSLIKNVEIARKLGMLDGVPPLLDEPRRLSRFYRAQMAIICTGAQGEERAAFAKLSIGGSRFLPKIMEGDAVIHSARAIPGNEEEIERVFDRFRGQGVAVHTKEYDGNPLHVTGHATAYELEMMYSFIQPKISIPVHGEEEHLEAHAAIATSRGVKNVFVPREGLVMRVTKDGIAPVADVSINLIAELTLSPGAYVDWDEEMYRHIQETEKAAELDEIYETSGQRMVA
jgi:ribonuclease J